MEEKKVVKISLSTLFLILAIIIIVIMTVFMYKFYNEKIEANEKTAELQTQVSNLNKTVSSLQEKVDEINSDKSNTTNANGDGEFWHTLPHERKYSRFSS